MERVPMLCNWRLNERCVLAHLLSFWQYQASRANVYLPVFLFPTSNTTLTNETGATAPWLGRTRRSAWRSTGPSR